MKIPTILMSAGAFAACFLLSSCLTERTVSEHGEVQEDKIILKVPGEQVLENTIEEDSLTN